MPIGYHFSFTFVKILIAYLCTQLMYCIPFCQFSNPGRNDLEYKIPKSLSNTIFRVLFYILSRIISLCNRL